MVWILTKKVWGSHHINNSNKSCCTLRCKSYAKKDTTVCFHTLPKAGKTKIEITNKLNNKEMIDRRLVWIKRLKISKNFSQATICSLHFTKEDYSFSCKWFNWFLNSWWITLMNIHVIIILYIYRERSRDVLDSQYLLKQCNRQSTSKIHKRCD